MITQTSYTDTSMTAGSTYYYAVQAKDCAATLRQCLPWRR